MPAATRRYLLRAASAALTVVVLGLPGVVPAAATSQLSADPMVDASQTPVGSGELEGWVRDGTTDDPIHVSVELWTENGTALVDQTWTGTGGHPQGFFRFTSVPAGIYQLRFGAVDPEGTSDYIPEWYRDADDVADASSIQVWHGITSWAQTAYLWSPTAEFSDAPTPIIDGPLTVGSTLATFFASRNPGTNGTWEPAPVTLTYQWERDGVDIPGATDPTYTLLEADAGSWFRVSVTGSKDGYRTVTKQSQPTAQVSGATLHTAPAPTISGETIAGNLLTAHAGDWGPAPVALSYQWIRNGTWELGNDPTYRLTNADAGATITVQVTGSKPYYTAVTRTSEGTGPVTGVVEARKPLITGVPANGYNAPDAGTILSAVSTGWTPTSATFTYQWERSGQPIAGAVESTYQVQAADGGHRLTVAVTGTAPGYVSATETSNPTNPTLGGVFTSAPSPTISGAAAVGETLTAEPGAWTPAAEVFHYQWLADGDPIWQADGPTYTIPGGFDHRVSVRVTAHRQGFDPTTRTSAQTAKVFPASPKPTISGTRAVGSTLTAKPGTWTWTSAPSFAYQWYRDGAAISGATKSTYRLTVWDAGKRITVRVVGNKTGYETTARTSSPTGMITGGKFSPPPTPKISGTTKVGSTLTAAAGTWAPTPVLSYSWKRNGKTISGASARSYTLTNSDAGARITVSVTGTRTGFPTTVKTSAATGTVTGGTFSGGSVTISGAKKVGATLTASRSGFSPTPAAYAYQWYRSGVKITGATKSTYRLTGSDVGKTIKVKVAAIRTGFTTKKATSAAHEPIVR